MNLFFRASCDRFVIERFQQKMVVLRLFQRRVSNFFLRSIYGGIPDLPKKSPYDDRSNLCQDEVNELMLEYVYLSKNNIKFTDKQKNQLHEVFIDKPGYFTPCRLCDWTNQRDSLETFIRRKFYNEDGTIDRCADIVDSRAEIMVNEIIDGTYPRYRISHKDSLMKPWAPIDITVHNYLEKESAKAVKTRLEEDPSDICYVSVEMLDNIDVMESVAQHESGCQHLWFASARVRNDWRISLLGLHYKEGEKVTFRAFGDDIRDNDIMFLIAYGNDPVDAYSYASRRIQAKYVFLKPFRFF